MKKAQGFTLIEVLVVVVIVAILAAVAIPSYQESLRKTRRADAKEALTRVAAAQERFFFTNNRYGTLQDLGLVPDGSTPLYSNDGHYSIVIVGNLNCGTAPNLYSCFTLQANPVATSPQNSDTTCGRFELYHTGKKAAYKKNDTNVNTTDKCW
jgi:type IV pilus assembly protein PilE